MQYLKGSVDSQCLSGDLLSQWTNSSISEIIWLDNAPCLCNWIFDKYSQKTKDKGATSYTLVYTCAHTHTHTFIHMRTFPHTHTPRNETNN